MVSAPISPAAFRVLVALLARRNSRTGRCFPGEETIATDTGMDVRSVRRAVAVLVKAELVEVDRPLGRTKSNHYTFPHIERTCATSRTHVWTAAELRQASNNGVTLHDDGTSS